MSGAVPGPSERLMLGADPKRLIVLRHGQTAHNVGGIWQGHLDTELSAVGRDQARAAGIAIAECRPDLIRASDLQRAYATAEAIAAGTGLAIQADERLREIDVGSWQGRSSDQVRETHGDDLEAIAAGEDRRRGDTGETVAEVAERALAATKDVIADLAPGQLGVIVTHGVAGRALAAALVGIELHAAWLGLGGLHNCHWVELTEGAHGWRIEKWNAHA